MGLELTQELLDRLKHLRTYPEWELFKEVLENEINELIEILISDGLSSDNKKLASHIATQASINAYRRVLVLPEFYEMSLKLNPQNPNLEDNFVES